MFAKIISWFMSIYLAIASFFGFYNPTKPPKPLDTDEIKNVIILIGDGMGFNHLASTEKEHNVALEMITRTDIHAEAQTYSISTGATDSAASGTALATGIKTINGYVGVYHTDPTGAFSVPASITEVAIKHGKSTGIVTSDSIMGATPSAFSAHVRDRGLGQQIFDQQVVTDIDLIWGNASSIVTKSAVEANGKVYVDSYDAVKNLEFGQKSIGQFDEDTLWTGEKEADSNQPTLSELAKEAIDILSEDEDGFFLMLEGAHIDKRSHKKDKDGAMKAVLEFDKAISTVLDFAEDDGETLVIITADHETGAVTLQEDGSYKWTSGSHSKANVPVFVYGYENFMTDDELLNNIDIPTRAVAVMTENKQAFPCAKDELSK